MVKIPSTLREYIIRIGSVWYQHVVDLVFAGVETALWNLVAKSVDKPLYKLLGDCVRREIKFAPWLWL